MLKPVLTPTQFTHAETNASGGGTAITDIPAASGGGTANTVSFSGGGTALRSPWSEPPRPVKRDLRGLGRTPSCEGLRQCVS